MKKFFLFAAALVAAMTIKAQEPNVVVLSDVANYIDFQALTVTMPEMTQVNVTSTSICTLPNGTELVGHLKEDETETSNTWNVKGSYNTTMPTPTWENVDSLKAGTMFRAGSGTTIVLGAFKTSADGKLYVYYQPNGDSERGVEISVNGEVVTGINLTGNGTKINGIRPAYAGEINLPADNYEAGDVVIKLVVNTSNIFGVRIDKLQGQGIENPNAAVKAVKRFENGQLIIEKAGRRYNALGAKL